MQRKYETFGKFKEFVAEAEKQLGKVHKTLRSRKLLKTLRSDRGGEYLDNEFKDFLIENGILSHLTAPNTLDQIGIAERKNGTLLDMVRSMKNFLYLFLSQ